MAMDRSRTGIMRDFSVYMVPPGVSYCAVGSVEGLGGRWCRGMREGGAGVVLGMGFFWGGGDAARYVVVVVGADFWMDSLTFLRHGFRDVARITAAATGRDSWVCVYVLVLAGRGGDQSSSGRIFKSFGLTMRCSAGVATSSAAAHYMGGSR